MHVRTLFHSDDGFALGDVEIKMLPGLPHLYVVGLPDAQIRESSFKIKAAVRSAGLEWPRGNQILVNLRPAHLRKTGSGVELAIALGFLAQTGQLAPEIHRAIEHGAIVYGEVALDGRAEAPADFAAVLAAFPDKHLITGVCDPLPREGRWSSLPSLNSESLRTFAFHYDWSRHWARPKLPELELHPSAFNDLVLAAHMGLNLLVCGPQGSGKSTFARALHALTPAPNARKFRERAKYFPDNQSWRPCEIPHHSITAKAMIGGGGQLAPGVISRAHGGVMIMDEFLLFPESVLEGLREPIENGFIDLSRQGQQAKFPASFQLIATSNLCPCGKLEPAKMKDEFRDARTCGYNLARCRSVCSRLSGPVMDRFDLLVFSHDWLRSQELVKRPIAEARKHVDAARAFAALRGPSGAKIPEWMAKSELSHRRKRSILRVARGLADLQASEKINEAHFQTAFSKVVDPMTVLGQLFG